MKAKSRERVERPEILLIHLYGISSSSDYTAWTMDNVIISILLAKIQTYFCYGKTKVSSYTKPNNIFCKIRLLELLFIHTTLLPANQ